MTRLAYDDERVIHSEDGGRVCYPIELTTRGQAIAETAKMAWEPFSSFTASRGWLRPAPAAETPPAYDVWWVPCLETDEGAQAFWMVRPIGEPAPRVADVRGAR